MPIAANIAQRLQGASAYTLYGGYAVYQDKPRALFPAGVQIIERRNDDGRVTLARYQYADDSILEFRWHPLLGPRLSVKTRA